MLAKVTQVLLFAMILMTSAIVTNIAYADIDDDIINALKRAAEGNLEKYDLIVANFKNSTDVFVVWNSSNVNNMTDPGLIQCQSNEHIELDKCVPNNGPVPVPDPECPEGQILVNGECQIPEEPGPGPEPNQTSSTSSIVFVGDWKGDTGKKLAAHLTSVELELLTSNGDLFYKNNLNDYNTNVESKFGNRAECTPGNHDVKEDGSAELEKLTLALCKDHWVRNVANGTTLVFGLNTNGDRQTQIDFVNNYVSNETKMDGIKNVFLSSHKLGHTFPGSHHPAEAAQLYNAIDTPDNVKRFEVYAHNHNLAAAYAKGWFVSGGGGANFYECGQNADWTFCNNEDNGYLKFDIDNNTGAVKAGFYDITGKILN